MNEKENKMKKWFKENKDEIVATSLAIVCSTASVGFGYFIGDKICGYRTASGISRLHDLGIFKFFDPSTGSEIDVNKAVEVARDLLKK